MTRRELSIAAAGFVAFFALLFVSMPLRGALPGNCDTWLNGVALPNLMLEDLYAMMGGPPIGRPFYPATGVFTFGESALGTSAMFMFFKAITGHDVFAYYLFTVVLCALNAVGVYLLARTYVSHPGVAAFAGLAFSASNYILGNLDSPHTSFFFVAFASFWAGRRYLENGERRDLGIAVVLAGVQAYFSAYVFLFTTIVLGLLLVRRVRDRPRELAVAAAVYLAIALPFFGSYALAAGGDEFSNPWDPVFLAELHSLEPSDLFRTLPHNVIYPLDQPVVTTDVQRVTLAMAADGIIQLENITQGDSRLVLGTLSSDEDVRYFVYTRRCAFLGLVLYVLAGFALWRRRELRRDLIVLYVGGVVLALGPVFMVGETLVPNIMYPAYRWLDAAAVFRVPSRAFSLSVLALVLAAAVGLEQWSERFTPQRRWIALAALTAVVLLENIPVPVPSFAGTEYSRVPETMASAVTGADQELSVVLNLPSRIGGALYRDSTDLFEWNRELIYMNHQTQHRQHIVNGVHGYFPRTRLKMQRTIDALPQPHALGELREVGVSHIVYHHELELPWETDAFAWLQGHPALRVVAQDDEVTVLRWADAVRREQGPPH